MRKILLIDTGESSVRKFERSLANKGFGLISEQNFKKAELRLNKDDVDLIAIDSSFLSDAKNPDGFRQLTASTPTIVLTRKDNFQQISLQLKERDSILVHEPTSFKVFKFWMDTLLDHQTLEDDINSLRARIRLNEKTINFFEEATKIFTSTTDLHRILNSIMKKVKTMAEAKEWSLIFNDEPFCEIVHFKTSKRIRKFRFRKGVGISGWVLEKARPLVVQDVLKDRHFDEESDKFPKLKVKSIICVPLQFKDRIIGVLRLINKKTDIPFTDYDLGLLVNAASYVAMAIERTFLYEEIKNDDLTNLYNFRYLHQVLDMEIERANRYGSLFSLVFMDLDDFKKVNDKYGHLIGSRLLIETSQILQRNLRRIDIITRYGGDEFVIILPQTPHESGFLVAERLRRVIEKNVFLRQEGFSIRLTASLGVASFPHDAKNKEELIHLADKAMYRGKFTTKNTVFAARR